MDSNEEAYRRIVQQALDSMANVNGEKRGYVMALRNAIGKFQEELRRAT